MCIINQSRFNQSINRLVSGKTDIKETMVRPILNFRLLVRTSLARVAGRSKLTATSSTFVLITDARSSTFDARQLLTRLPLCFILGKFRSRDVATDDSRSVIGEHRSRPGPPSTAGGTARFPAPSVPRALPSTGVCRTPSASSYTGPQ